MFRQPALAYVFVALGCSSGAATHTGTPDASATDASTLQDVSATDLGSSSDASTATDATGGGGTAGTTCDPFASPSICNAGLVCTTVLTLSGNNVTSSNYQCVSNPSPIAMGQPCSSVQVTITPSRIASNCGPQLVCISTGSGSGGVCAPLCTMTHATCPSGNVCAPITATGDVGACSNAPATCDPVAQTGCASATACYLEYAIGETVAACLTPSDPSTAVPENGDCTGGGCAAGFTCYPDDPDAGVGAGHCRRFCAPGASTNNCATATPHCDMLTLTGTANPVGICQAM